MTPVGADQYFFWISGSVVSGLLLATYVGVPRLRGGGGGALGGGAVGYLAIGCPVCNKLVVALIGAAGAMDYFAPLLPVLGVAGLLLLAAALAHRLRALRSNTCAVEHRPEATSGAPPLIWTASSRRGS
jgi:hypothetical protein